VSSVPDLFRGLAYSLSVQTLSIQRARLGNKVEPFRAAVAFRSKQERAADNR